MKKLLSLHLAFVLLLSSLVTLAPVVQAATKASTCENGECIPKLVSRLEELGKVYQRECLPKGIKESELKAYHEKNGLSEQCWKYITEVNHLESQLQQHQSRLESRLGCESGECKLPNANQSLNSQIRNLSKTEQTLSCTAPKKQAIKNSCGSDLTCAFVASAMGIGGLVADKLVPSKMKPKGCNLGNDSCATNLATGFIKAVFSFFEGAWDLLKMAGGAAKKQMTKFWNWVSGAEKHSSTSQLALAKASEDPGFFKMLVSDFPGTMKKIWEALVGSIKEWLKTDIFCEKWKGVPRFSQCLQPAAGFDCISCKSMVNGMCAITGTLVAEIVPAFLTGGLTTAAKYGISGAAKIAKTFKISSKGLKAIKASRVGKVASEAASKTDEILKLTRGLEIAKVGVEASLAAIRKYLLSPGRKLVKASFTALSSLAKNTTLYVAATPAGKVLAFSGKAAKVTGKAILYPIDNPMTTFAFKAGQRSFERAIKVGSPKLAVTSSVAAKVIDNNKEMEILLARIQEAKTKDRAADVLKLEQDLLSKVEPKRRALVKEALDDNKADFDEVIRHLYPELQYGELAKTLPPEKILAAEKELYLEISALTDSPAKTALMKRYDSHVIQGPARARVVKDNAPTYAKILQNAELPDTRRFDEAMKLLKREALSPEEKQKLAKALEEAHLAGPDNGVFEYSWSELREKYRILTEGGFTKDEADILIRAGLAGRPPVRELVNPGDTLFSGFAEDIIDGDYMARRRELEVLVADMPAEPKGVLGKIQGMFSPNSHSKKILDNIESVYFVDYTHSADTLTDVLFNEKAIKEVAMAERYEAKAFENFKTARRYLIDEQPPVEKQTLLEIHRRMMKGGVENVPEKDMGIIRDGMWYGNVPKGYEIDNTTLKAIQDNPYLTWTGAEITPGKFVGQIQYPNALHVQKQGLDLLRKKDPQLVIEIQSFQKELLPYKQKLNEYQSLTKFGNEYPANANDVYQEYRALYNQHSQLLNEKGNALTKRLVDALVDDAMETFNRQRALLGKIDSAEKMDQFVNIAAKFQRDLVSIHPLANGNGRSTRELLSHIFMKEGFPPPRIIDPNADLYSSLPEWQKIVKHGVLASDWMIDDLIERVKFGLPIDNSIEIITPYTRPPVKMNLKGQKGQKVMDGVEYIDPRLYREIVRREMEKDPGFEKLLKTKPIEAWDKIHQEVGVVFTKNNVYYNHPKNGIERVSLNFVDDDFIELYGKASYANKDLYEFKMNTWYSKDITWRGLASKTQEKSEEEIITMFKQLTTHNASNAVLRKVRTNDPEAIRKAAIEDFDKYDDDVFGTGLVQMAKDHSETGPMYGMSYGYSTSKNRDVGKAFAMGAMVVGKYGEQKAPELQALLKSRVLVGARRANKDVDLGRLKQLREEFSYKYGRQQEVMGIGASDPDAITIVQTLDAKGEPILSYLRNQNNPNEVWVVKGAIEPDEVPRKEQIMKSIFLDQK